MRRPSLLLAVTLFVLGTVNLSAADTLRVVRVTGVDSFVLEDGSTIGLLGITKPDGKGVTTAACDEHLRGLIEGKDVIIVADTTVQDVDGKPLQRLVYLNGGLINLQMISDGYARPSSTPHQLSGSFAAAHSAARSAGVGAWAVREVPTPRVSSRDDSENSTSRQWSGTTQRGTRCKRMTTDGSGRCWQH